METAAGAARDHRGARAGARRARAKAGRCDPGRSRGDRGEPGERACRAGGPCAGAPGDSTLAMERKQLADLLAAVQSGACSIPEALVRLRDLPFEDLDFAKIDHHRALRNGFPEAILGEGKSAEQVLAIATRMAATDANVLITRLAPEVAAALVAGVAGFEYHPVARLAVRRGPAREPTGHGTVLVVSAGTADVPVAEEAAITAELMGNRVTRLFDVGVAGIHRLLERRTLLWEAAGVIVVAGMEGALTSVVGGLVDRPVIAVPTSMGYGTSLAARARLCGE